MSDDEDDEPYEDAGQEEEDNDYLEADEEEDDIPDSDEDERTYEQLPAHDQSYKRNWKRYKKFINDKRQLTLLPNGPLYLTRDNVDYFFQHRVKHLTVTPQTANKYVPSLQFYADNWEHKDTNPEFIVRNGPRSQVQKALDHQANTYTEDYIMKRQDAHARLHT